MRKKVLKYSLYLLTVLTNLWAAIGYADSIPTLLFFLSPSAIFLGLVLRDVIRWVNNLDRDYNIDFGVKIVSKAPAPIKVKGIPQGMSFNEYLVSINKNDLIE